MESTDNGTNGTTVKINVRVKRTVIERLDRDAKRRGRTRSWVIQQLLAKRYAASQSQNGVTARRDGHFKRTGARGAQEGEA